MTRDTVARQGYESLSMRGLAQNLRCSPGTIYLYFTNKNDLLRSVVDEAFAELHHTITAIPQDGDPLGMLRRALRAYVDFGLREPSAYKCAFVLAPAKQRAQKPHRAYDVLRTHVQSCIDAGLLRKRDVEASSQTIWACIHGLTSLLISRPSFPWIEREQLITQLLDVVLGGLLADSANEKEGRNGERDGNRA